MEPTNDILDETMMRQISGVSTPERQLSSSENNEHYKRVEYNGSPIPNIILTDREQHCPGRIAYYTFKIINPGNKLTRKKINIIKPIGHLITKSWSNIQSEYMIDMYNILLLTIEITQEDSYEVPEVVFHMKKGEEIRLTFETIDEARDCQLYLYSIMTI
jgi:hypothetical protein